MPPLRAAIFPLRFGGQAKALAGQLVQPPDKFLGVFPAHVFDRIIPAFVKIGWVEAHDPLPLFLGHFGLSDLKLIQAHFVNGLLIFSAFSIPSTAAHLETAAAHRHHLQVRQLPLRHRIGDDNQASFEVFFPQGAIEAQAVFAGAKGQILQTDRDTLNFAFISGRRCGDFLVIELNFYNLASGSGASLKGRILGVDGIFLENE